FSSCFLTDYPEYRIYKAKQHIEDLSLFSKKCLEICRGLQCRQENRFWFLLLISVFEVNTEKSTAFLGKLSNISTRSSPKMADALMNPIDMDALVKKITTEVLVGVEKALENKIDPVLEKLSAVATHVEQVENRVTEAETRISAVEDTVSRDNADLNEVKKKLDAALEKIDDLENRSRRCNIRIIGLPEGEEGTNPVSFLRTWLPNLLNTDFKNHQVKIERAHRVPSRLPTSGERPRALMVKLHNFQDKARILQAARTASQLVYKRIRFAMIYPATLRIGLQHNGSEKFFKQPAELECKGKNSYCISAGDAPNRQ
uniref:L1 transposable element RRM domain-containing protein n=1 Tax=Sinocyclocheilus anshuiensis TaxID=1608454 RepID=A0A671QJC2_9TELE